MRLHKRALGAAGRTTHQRGGAGGKVAAAIAMAAAGATFSLLAGSDARAAAEGSSGLLSGPGARDRGKAVYTKPTAWERLQFSYADFIVTSWNARLTVLGAESH